LHPAGQVCVTASVSMVSCLSVRIWCGPSLPFGGLATELEELKFLIRPGTGSRAHGPRRSESLNSVGLQGRPKGRCGANGTGPPRGPLEDWSGPEVGLTSESRVHVALIRVAARPVLDVRAGSAGCSPGSVAQRARQLSESNLRGLEGLAPLGMCRAEDDLAALCGLTWSNRLRPDSVLGFPTGVRARRSEGPASVALLLASGCREV
jgi:hypothetical protein